MIQNSTQAYTPKSIKLDTQLDTSIEEFDNSIHNSVDTSELAKSYLDSEEGNQGWQLVKPTTYKDHKAWIFVNNQGEKIGVMSDMLAFKVN